LVKVTARFGEGGLGASVRRFSALATPARLLVAIFNRDAKPPPPVFGAWYVLVVRRVRIVKALTSPATLTNPTLHRDLDQ